MAVAGCAVLLTACNTTPHLKYSAQPMPAQPTSAEVRKADALRQSLPAELWLSPAQVQVEPAPGRIVATITDIHDPQMQDAIANRVRAVNTANPLFPVWVEFR